MNEIQHAERVKKELLRAGITRYGLLKMEAKYLPKVIHEDESIGGVVYGRYKNGSGMLIATNKRVIFLDRKPLFVTNEEVTYDVVSGLELDVRGMLSSITLHTRVKDFVLLYVNQTCATQFKAFVEQIRLEKNGAVTQKNKEETAQEPKEEAFYFFNNDALRLITRRKFGTLSTTNEHARPHGAAVYYIIDELHRIYILTKTETEKAKDIAKTGEAALTVFDESTDETLQIHCKAYIETNEKVRRYVFDELVRPRTYSTKVSLPPVAWIRKGSFVVIRLEPVAIKYNDYALPETVE